MDWKLFSIAPAIFMVVLFLLSLYGGVKLWKYKNKFAGFLFFLIAVGIAIMLYAIYGKQIFG